jgi:hypothetical protein
MSQWAREHPERMEQISRLPLAEQPAALRDAVTAGLGNQRRIPGSTKPTTVNPEDSMNTTTVTDEQRQAFASARHHLARRIDELARLREGRVADARRSSDDVLDRLVAERDVARLGGELHGLRIGSVQLAMVMKRFGLDDA